MSQYDYENLSKEETVDRLRWFVRREDAKTEILAKLVRLRKAQEARVINNGGVDEQLWYLLQTYTGPSLEERINEELLTDDERGGE